ncbi:MAG TPA: hypothetical protein VGP98_00985 [Pyrinomonadaceae bacterium]|jgi:hypothetical protein|nr:hypothetical protein [Pyrinomonadaceae bacterium]
MRFTTAIPIGTEVDLSKAHKKPSSIGGNKKMADDRMKNDDVQRNMGTKDEQDFGRQSPGRSGQAGQQGGQHSGGQHGGQQGGQQGGQFGGQKGARNMDDDEDFDTGKSSGGQNRGGQNR